MLKKINGNRINPYIIYSIKASPLLILTIHKEKTLSYRFLFSDPNPFQFLPSFKKLFIHIQNLSGPHKTEISSRPLSSFPLSPLYNVFTIHLTKLKTTSLSGLLFGLQNSVIMGFPHTGRVSQAPKPSWISSVSLLVKPTAFHTQLYKTIHSPVL